MQRKSSCHAGENMDYINFDNVSFEYDNGDNSKNKALDGVSFSVPKGQFVAVLGHNGCGKSTLAKHINTLLTPTSGVVTVNGICADSDEKIWEVRSHVGMVFQNPDNQIVASVVEDEVAFGAENLGIPTEQMEKNVDQALRTVGMEDYRQAGTAQLSGGQKQRISIAGILAMMPECIIFDESTAMLDPMGRKDILKTAKRLNKEQGITVVFITHFMEEAAAADRIIVMSHGKIVMDDMPANVFLQVEQLKELRLSVPQMTDLAYRLNNRGLNIGMDIMTTDEMAERLEKLDLMPADISKEEYKPLGDEILRAEGLTHIYSRGLVSQQTALDDVSFTVYKGEFISIIGHTGSGKSTLIQHLNGLITPDEGAVYFKGQDINRDKNKLHKIRQHIGLVFQYPEHQLFEMTVKEDIAFGPKNLGLDEEEIQERILYAAGLVGLTAEELKKSPFELSGGQKRRAAIAGVLAMKPEVIVLDEPMAGLDPMGREEILSVINRLNKDEGITILLVSHSMEDAARLSDRILVMNKGRAEIFDTPENVFSHTDLLKNNGLDIPQVSSLFMKLSHKGLPKGVFTVDRAEEIICRSLGITVT